MTLFLVLSVAVTGLLLALARPIAAVMSTPAEAVSGTVAYLTHLFSRRAADHGVQHHRVRLPRPG